MRKIIRIQCGKRIFALFDPTMSLRICSGEELVSPQKRRKTEAVQEKFGFKVNDHVTWTNADNNVPRKTKGTILSFTKPASVCKFYPRGVLRFPTPRERSRRLCLRGKGYSETNFMSFMRKSIKTSRIRWSSGLSSAFINDEFLAPLFVLDRCCFSFFLLKRSLLACVRGSQAGACKGLAGCVPVMLGRLDFLRFAFQFYDDLSQQLGQLLWGGGQKTMGELLPLAVVSGSIFEEFKFVNHPRSSSCEYLRLPNDAQRQRTLVPKF